MYNYEKEKENLFTEDNQQKFLTIRDNMFTMIKDFEEYKGKSFNDFLIDGGFDPDTFKIEVKLKKDE